MSDDPQLPAWARPRPIAGADRPTWVTVLGFLMLLSGGILLISGLKQIDGRWTERLPPEDAPAEVIEDVRAANAAMAEIYGEHPIAVGVDAAAKVVAGLVMLFAVAALFALDPRARRAVLVAAWVQIGYQAVDTAFQFTTAAPALTKLIARQVGALGSAGMAPTLVAAGIVGSSLVGVLFSVVILVFFGGRRGRAFFSARAAAVRPQPHHGG